MWKLNMVLGKKGIGVVGAIIAVVIGIIIASFISLGIQYLIIKHEMGESFPPKIIPLSTDVISWDFWLDNENHLNVFYQDNSARTNWVYVSAMDNNGVVQWSENHASNSFTATWDNVIPTAYYSISLWISHMDYGMMSKGGFYYGTPFGGIPQPPS